MVTSQRRLGELVEAAKWSAGCGHGHDGSRVFSAEAPIVSISKADAVAVLARPKVGTATRRAIQPAVG
jgi:hypothetical protein